MSAGGIYAELRVAGQARPVLLMGAGVPRIHQGDGLPVYLVAVHSRGTLIKLRDGKTLQRLLAYPIEWSGPGARRSCSA